MAFRLAEDALRDAMYVRHIAAFFFEGFLFNDIDSVTEVEDDMIPIVQRTDVTALDWSEL